MKPFFYELKRTITGKAVIILFIVILVFSSLSAISSAQSNSSDNQVFMTTNAYGYGANDTYHIFIQLFDQYGDAISNADVNLLIANGSVFSKYSNVQGYANFTLSDLTPAQLSSPPGKFAPPPTASNEVNMYFNATLTQGSSSMTVSNWVSVYLNQSNRYFFTTITPTKTSNGTVINNTGETGRYGMYTISIPGQPSRYGFEVLYQGNAGWVSPSINIYYERFNLPGNQGSLLINSASLNETNMTNFGSYNSFAQMSVNPSNLSSTNSTLYLFAIFTPGGKLLSYILMQIYIPASVSQVNSQFFGTEMTIIGLFVPLMAVTSGYMTFGKDKASGILESTLVRPVTRRGVIVPRFFANVLAAFLASVLAFLLSSLIFSYLLGTGLPPDTILYGLFAIFVSISAYTGIIYFASGILKSQGHILAAAIGSFIVLDVLWSSLFVPVIPYAIIIEVFRASPGTVAFAKGYFTMFYYSPSGYSNIASYLLTKSNPIYTTGNVTASQLGVSLSKFLLGGILWILIPAVLALVAFIKRD